MIPLTTAGCEKTFSRLNLIKTELRNRMETETLQHHMNISINGPEIKDIEQFKFEEVINMWR